MKRHCLALDLKDDPDLIAKYIACHKSVSATIKASITNAGITVMDIFCTGNRLFMIIETTPDFDFVKKAAMDAANEKVQEWEVLVSQFQQALPWAKPGEKWVLMDQIFQL